MPNANVIEFKRERELGQIINDTFAFVRYTYKSLFQVVFKIVGPVLLITLLAFLSYLYVLDSGSLKLADIMTNTNPLSILEGQFSGMFLMSLNVLFIISLLFYAVFYAAINYSIASYIENEGKIAVEEVAHKVKQNIGKFLGLAVLASLIVGVGLFLCLIPGIYLYVPMSLVFPIMVFHDFGIGHSITYSFKLIKNNWWMSFLTFLIMGLVYYIISSVFQAPAFIYTFVKTLISASTDGFSGAFNWIYIILLLIGALGRFVLYGFMIISGTLIYFNLNEKRNQTGAYETIENLGNHTTD